MFKLLRTFFGRTSQPPAPSIQPDPEQELSDTEILQEYFSPPKEVRQALKRFTQLISRHLGSEESKRLTNRVMACLQPGETIEDALISGLVGENGQQDGKWIMLSADWREVDELEWQANRLLQAFGITTPWQLEEAERTTLPHALLALSAWVRQHGLSLMHVRADSYAAFLVDDKDLPAVIELASQAGLTVQDGDEFARENLS